MSGVKRTADWHGLASVDEDLAVEVLRFYHSLVQFDGAFEDPDGAAELVSELLGDKKPASEVERISSRLWNWREKRQRREPRTASLLQRSITSLPVKVPRRQVDMHEIFDEAASTTPAVAIAQLQRAVKVSRAAGSKDDLEAQMRERWALVLLHISKSLSYRVQLGWLRLVITISCGCELSEIDVARHCETERDLGSPSGIG